jgi:hypothetical protein
MDTSEKLRLEIPESFAMCCWRRMEKISWTDCVKNREVLRSGKEHRMYDKKKEG